MLSNAPAPWEGSTCRQLLVGLDSSSAPFWKNAAPGPALGTAVASAPFEKYCAA
jgi:hypothetical protein